MSSGRTLAYDPAVTAVTLVTFKDPAAGGTGPGGGLVGGNGTFYSKASPLDNISDVSDLFSFTGTIAGTLTCEVSNDDDDADRVGTSKWTTYDRVSGAGFTAGVATLAGGTITGGSNPEGVELQRLGFARVRYKLVVTSGTGTIRDMRTVKRSG
jgi:hypothetical protein